MKRFILPVTALAALSFVAMPALAQSSGSQSRGMVTRQDGPYGSLSLNYSFTGESTSGAADLSRDNGFGAHAALGHSWENWRAEAELGWMSSDTDPSGDIRMLTGMGNVYYDFRSSSRLTPYAGGGIGVANVDFDRVPATGVPLQFNDSDTVFAWQVMGGVTYALNPSMDLFGGYRYFRAEGADADNQAGQRLSADLTNHIVETGVKYRF